MSFEIIFMFLLLAAALFLFATDYVSFDVAALILLVALLATGILTPQEGFSGINNPATITIAAMFVISEGLRRTGLLNTAGNFFCEKMKENFWLWLFVMLLFVSFASSFMNNTAVIMIFIPVVIDIASRIGVSASKLLMPLSYAAILGGMCTLIGTSTNLITHGLLQSHGFEGLSFFELAWVGVPCTVGGLIYIVFVSPKLTPARRDIRYQEERIRKLLVELEVTEGADIINKKVKDTGLMEFPGFYLSRINRNDQEIAPVSEDEKIRAGDHLFYAAKGGVAAKKPDIEGYPGLRLAFQPPRKIRRDEKERELHQVVVKEGSRLVGSTVGEANLLDRFGAAVTGVRRRGTRIDQPLGEFTLHPGDVLLLDTGRGFRGAYEDTEDFFLTSEAGGEAPGDVSEIKEHRPGGKELYISIAVLVGIVGLVALGLLHIALAGVLGVAVLLTFNVIEAGEARKSVDWTVLIVIGAALGLGKAMEVSGTAVIIGEWMVDLTSVYGPRTVLAGIVIVTVILTEVITNNGAVALMFPIALSIAETQGLEARPLIIGITLASSMSLLTPIGYQTNLMVYGPGNYKFTDFFKVGFPLQIVLWILVILLVPIIWPM
jgi:di/tricarboxylate transporter